LLAHFFLQVKGRLQAAHGLEGRYDLFPLAVPMGMIPHYSRIDFTRPCCFLIK
jgi:hypothetical protein